MTPKAALGVGLMAMALGGLTGDSVLREPARAEATAARSAANPMADLLRGRLFPTSLTRGQLMPDYHLVGLVDAQGKTAVYASKGDTVTIGGEVFLAVYQLPDPPKNADSDKAPEPPARLLLVNLRHVQALGGIRDMPPPSAPAAAPTPGPEKP